ncbi:hypothetical protein Lesp02_72780 [Lentzea sp. NBRC 105346]|uniref:hypothetical protein n=1 Tax=Lentzea sp. NBRC 105346 TaxID=3032205 RepID=UPI0024A281DB|nr:hypothetical protein [Lentzea sp. NBRC 105346]GLZ35091.1 hypothetical protein Lesp02_72780 [Lentzea sp. NBRC 105346]
MSKRLSIGLGLLLALVGAVWTFQGLGYLEGSFMTGQKLWTAIGLLCVGGGLWLLVAGIRRE